MSVFVEYRLASGGIIRTSAMQITGMETTAILEVDTAPNPATSYVADGKVAVRKAVGNVTAEVYVGNMMGTDIKAAPGAAMLINGTAVRLAEYRTAVPGTATWPLDGAYIGTIAVTGIALETAARVEVELIDAVKDESEQRSMRVMSSGGSKKAKYAAKAVEVENWNSLSGIGATTATLTTALGLLNTTTRKRKFRFAIADAAMRGDAVADAIGRFTAGADASNAEVARIEAIEQAAVAKIKAATTVVAKRAAYAAIDWTRQIT